ncbi:MAG: hypothetical protein AAB353_01460 [Candidatus Hydrogenedentota bacterium]
MKAWFRSLAARVAVKLLRLTNAPRQFDTLHSAGWINGGAMLRERYGAPPPQDHSRRINAYEARAFSQRGEDGILLYIFSRIGTINKRFVEFGVEDGRECNTTNLAINFGWRGLMMDGGLANVAAGRAFFAAMVPDDPAAVTFEQAWITRENINQLLNKNSLSGEIDLLSIDVDGNDYWIWKEINVIKPRVVVIEYNPSFGAERSVTVPYEAEFDRWQKHPTGYYHGASLAALEKLGRELGYRLVGCSSWGSNAFFVRADLAGNEFSGFCSREVYIPGYVRLLAGYSTEQQFNLIRGLPLVDV